MIAILGGGITALSAAYQLKKSGIDFILIEKESSLGGKIQTIQKDGYTCELGPNTVLINNKEIKELIDQLELEKQLIFPQEKAVKKRFVLKNGKLEAIPNSFKTMIKSKLISFRTIFNILRERFKAKKTSDHEESLAEFVTRRFGNQIYEDLVTPFVTGIYAGNPEKMSINYVLNILKESEQKHGSVMKGMMKIMKEKKAQAKEIGLPKQKIFTFKDGLQTLIDKIEEKVKDHILLDAEVTEVIKQGESYTINYSKKDEETTLKVNGIISTIPAHALASIYNESDIPFSSSLNKINSVPAVVIHLGYDKSQINFKEEAFGILSKARENVPFLGILFNSRFFPHTSSKSNELLTIICGGYKNPELIKKEENEIIKEVKNSIEPLLAIHGEPNFVHLKKWEKGIPQYELGYSEVEESIKEFEKNNPRFYIGGNFYNGISVSDCIANGVQLTTHFY